MLELDPDDNLCKHISSHNFLKKNIFVINKVVVRLNLFNHVLALFRAKFACILAIRDPVFRWKLCKSCVWESVKKTQDVCIQRSLATRSHNWLVTGKSPQWHKCEACRELKGHDSWSTTRQNIQSSQTVNSRLNLVTCSTRETESTECPVWM